MAAAIALIGTAAVPRHAVAQQVEPAAQPAATKPAKAPVKRAAKAAAPADKQAAAKPTLTREEAGRLLDTGQAAQSAGKNDEAVKAFTQAISSGALESSQVARALLRRGTVHGAQGKSSAAISDLSQALYLGGLSDSERGEARQQRGQAYQSAGLADQAQADFRAAKSGAGDERRPQMTAAAQPAGSNGGASSSEPSAGTGFFGGWFGGPSKVTQPAPVASIAQASPTPPAVTVVASPIQTASVPVIPVATAAAPTATAPPAGGGVSSFFGGLFGGTPSSATPAQASQPQPQAAPPLPAASRVDSAAIGSNGPSTAVSASEPTYAAGVPRTNKISAVSASVSTASTTTAVSAAPTPGKAAAGAKTEGKKPESQGVRIQVASLRSEERAQSLVQEIRNTQADLLEGREPQIEKSAPGGMGTLYLVQFGPFASEADGQQLCPRLRRRGLDCLIVR